MKTNKTKKRKSGFTLVELIVVIAILAILAGIAIPVYSGYIKKANEAADLTQLDSLKTAAVFAYTEAQVKADPANVNVTVNSISYTCDGNGQVNAVTVGTDTTLTSAIQTLMGGTFPTLKSDYKNGGSWNGTVWSAAAAAAAPEEPANP